MTDQATVDYALDLFSAMGGVSVRRMFGGAGLYAQGVMFGLIDDGQIYLKVDESLKAALKAEGSRSWIYSERKGPLAGVPQETTYWSLPDTACEDSEEACAWGRRALAVAAVIRAAKPARRRRRTDPSIP